MEAAPPALFCLVLDYLGVKDLLCVIGGVLREFLGCTAETVKRGGNMCAGRVRGTAGAPQSA
jgi:hypothetical protein